jgi:protein gp37
MIALTREAVHAEKSLRKRSDRLLELSPLLPWKAHICMGVSVENQTYTFRIGHLRRTGAMVKFLSLEPLLGLPPSLNLKGIDWVIVGGESGPGARPIDPAWVLEIRNQCLDAFPSSSSSGAGRERRNRDGNSKGVHGMRCPN